MHITKRLELSLYSDRKILFIIAFSIILSVFSSNMIITDHSILAKPFKLFKKGIFGFKLNKKDILETIERIREREPTTKL